MKNRLLFLAIFLPFIIKSQDLDIVYDVEKGTVQYFQNSIKLDNPSVKEGQKIKLTIVNYNNYLYDVEFEESFNENSFGSGMNIMDEIQNPIVGIPVDVMAIPDSYDGASASSPMSDPISGISYADGASADPLTSPISPIVIDENSLELWKKYEEEKIKFEKERLEIEREKLRIEAERRKEEMILKIIYEAEKGIVTLNRLEERISDRRFDILEINRRENQISSAGLKVSNLKYNHLLTTKVIKAQCISVLQKAFGIDSSIDFDDLEGLFNRDVELQEMLIESNTDIKSYQRISSSLNPIIIELNSLAPERSNVILINTKVQQIYENQESFLSSSQQISDSIASLINYYHEKDGSEIMELYYAYEDIRNNTFEITHRTKAQKDEVILNVTLQLKNDISNSDASQIISLNPIHIPVYGGLKINTGVGLNFSQFIDPVKTYFKKDNVIASQNGDKFIPFLASFMHFYYQGKKSTSLGGSLGIGVPIGGGNGLESTTFSLGPSLFIGNTNRIIINIGMMGGKVDKLGEGLQEGDSLSNGQNFIPLQSTYDFGFYMGLSFNLRK